MKILIDCQGMQTGSAYRGIGRYCHELIDGLICQRPDEVEIALLIDGSRQESAAKIFSDFKNREVKFVYWYSASLATLPAFQVNNAEINSDILYEAAVLNSGADVLLIGSLFEGIIETFCLPVERLHGKIKIVSICYDFIPFTKLSLASTEFRYWYARSLMRLRLCDLLLCISDYVKQRAEQLISGIKAINISGGVNLQTFSKFPSDSAICKRLLTSQNISYPYFLYAGGLDDRKNVDLLVDAFSELIQDNLMGVFQLVVVSGNNIGRKNFLINRVSSRGLSEKIKILGHVTDQELSILYRNAFMFVFPSREEGLGLPVLEAMASGIPVLSSNATSLPEVHGMPEGQFSPNDKAGLKSLLLKSTKDISFYNALLEHCRQQVSLFTWSNTAKRVYLAFENLGNTFEKKGITLDQVLTQFSLREQSELERKSFAQAVCSQFYHRIYVDITGVISTDYLSGIQRVVRKLSEALPAYVPENYEVVYIGLLAGRFYSFKCENDCWRKQSEINPKPFDVVLFLDLNAALPYMDSFITSLKSRGVLISTVVYDLVYELYPETVQTEALQPLKKWLDYVTGVSDTIICISNSVKKELVVWCGQHKKKVPNISYFHLGSNIANDEHYKNKYNCEEKKIFKFVAVSTVEPRKGYDLLLRTFNKIFHSYPLLELHIIGKKGWNVQQLSTEIVNSPFYNRQLFWHQGVGDDELIKLMSSADAYVNASIYEGFGLPVVEATKYSLPLFLRDIPVFKELAGENAYYFSNEEDLIDLVQNFIKNSSNFTPMPEQNVITWSQSAEWLISLLPLQNN